MLFKIFHSYRDSFSGLPREIWYLSLVTLINRAGTMVLAYLVLYLHRVQGLSMEAAGLIYGLYGLGAIIGNLLGGWLSDRIGPNRIQTASLIVGGLGLVVLGQLEDPTAIAILLLPLGIICEAFRPANSTAIGVYSPPHLRTRAFGLVRLAMNLGMGIGPVVGGFLAESDYSLLFLCDGLTCCLAGVMLWALLGRCERERIQDEAPEDASPAIGPWADRPFLGFTMLFALLILAFSQLQSTVPLYFKNECGFSESTIGLILGINPVIIVLVEMPILAAVSTMRTGRVLAWGSLLITTGFALMPLSPHPAFVIFTVLIWTLGEMLNFPLGMSVISTRAPDATRGKYMGVTSMSFSTAFMISPVVGTWAYSNLGPAGLWGSVGVLGIGLFLAFWFYPERIYRTAGEKEFEEAEPETELEPDAISGATLDGEPSTPAGSEA